MRTLRRTLVVASVLGFADALVLNQGVVAVVTAVAAVVGGVPRAVAAFVRNDRPTAKLRVTRTAIYVAMAIFVVVANTANGHMARRRAEALIAACRQYQTRHGRLPERLDDLVPAFIASVPLAKYTLNYPLNTFLYSARAEQHMLMWVAFPPFGRPYYIFEDNRWGYLD